MVKLHFSMILPVLAAGVVVASLACSNEAPTPARHGAPRKQSPTAAAPANEYPMIVRVVGRHQTITVTTGPAGPLYTAATTDGRVLVADATLDRLRTEHPAIYQQLNPMTAVKDEAGAGRDDESNPSAPANGPRSAARAPVMLMSSAAD